jgi:hypothetical protein
MKPSYVFQSLSIIPIQLSADANLEMASSVAIDKIKATTMFSSYNRTIRDIIRAHVKPISNM